LAALAMGATRVLGVARNQELLHRVKAIAPERIDVLSVANGASVEEWAKALTDGEGVDAVIDCLPPRASADAQLAALRALRMGGKWVDVGGVSQELKLPPYYMKNRNLTLTAGRWFTTEQGAEMAEMVRAGILDMSVFEHRRYPLAKVNEAIDALDQGEGGFTNFVVIP
jgi:alcohol dehydrogenase